MTSDILKQSFPCFRDLPPDELSGVMHFFDFVSLTPGDELWVNDDNKSYVGFILNGKIGVKKQLKDSKREVILGVYTAGSMVGELSLLSDKPSSVSAKAFEPTDMIVLHNCNFQEMLDVEPMIGLSLLKHLFWCTSKRLDQSYERIASIF